MKTQDIDDVPMTFADFSAKHQFMTVRKLRWIDQQSKQRKNSKGVEEPPNPKFAKFSPAFTRVGRSVYVIPETFIAIVKGEAAS